MLKWIALFIVPSAFAAETFISVSYYDGLGRKFRVEKVVSYVKCEEKVTARKIILDEVDELREIALFGPDGKMIEESNANNNPELRAKVEAAFLAASRKESPCSKPEPEEKKKSGSSSTTPQ